ncbi:hypothetical protein [Paenibacillus phage SV21]|nr:hypothetical protein [Paenibacillus phage SV21]
MSRKSAITTLEKRIEKLQKRNEILVNAEFRQCKEIEKLVQDNRKLQSELEQERHFAEGLSKANEVLARKYRAEKARADAMAKFLKEEDIKDVKCDS